MYSLSAAYLESTRALLHDKNAVGVGWSGDTHTLQIIPFGGFIGIEIGNHAVDTRRGARAQTECYLPYLAGHRCASVKLHKAV